jgi:hypothetical protein
MDVLTHENEWKVNEMLNRMEADGREEQERADFPCGFGGISARTSTVPAGQLPAVYVAHDDVAGESRTAPAVQVASAAGSVAHCQTRASELAPFSPVGDIQVELGFQLIVSSFVSGKMRSRAFERKNVMPGDCNGVSQIPGIILGDAVAVPNHRRASLDDLKEDVAFAHREKNILPLTDRLKDTLTSCSRCFILYKILKVRKGGHRGLVSR